MRTLICLFTILSGVAFSAQPLPGQLPRLTKGGGVIYRCLFDRSCDANNDGWPDFWARKTGIDEGIPFPEHIAIAIAANGNPFGNHSLRIEVNGGGAGAFTPKIPIRPGMSYSANVHVDVTGLVHNEVYLLLSFHGSESSSPLRTVVSESIRNTGGWRLLEVGPIIADMKGVESASIGLLAVPTNRQDFGATVDFTNVELKESPTVSLTTLNRHHIFSDIRGIDIDCKLSGVDPEQKVIAFSLEDPFGRVIAKREIEMMINNLPAGQFVANPTDHWTVLYARAAWQSLPILSPGFYRIRVSTPEAYIQSLDLPEGVFFRDPLLDTVPLNFVVMPPSNFVPRGEFGWNLDGLKPDDIVDIRSLLMQSGISRLKISAWLTNDAETRDRQTLNNLCEDFMRQQVGLVGLLHPSPQEIRDKVKVGEANAGAIYLLNPDDWAPTLHRTMQELSLLVTDWQLTSDDDLSFSTIPLFGQHLGAIRTALDRNNFRFGIGFAQSWEQELPLRFEEVQAGMPPPNEFVALTSTVPLSPEELRRYLEAAATSEVRRWVSLQPLSARIYALEDRARDLVEQMIVAKGYGAEAVFLSKPFDDRSGIMRADGTPSELFLPWRTTVSMISGKPFLGSVTLPNRSRNYNFLMSGNNAVMAVWNDKATADKPIVESLYLGDDVEIVDLWGKRVRAEHDGRNQVIPVGLMPVFVTGLNADIIRLRQSLQLEKTNIQSFPRRKVDFPLRLRNTTAFPLTAQLSIVPPNGTDWIISQSEQSLSLDNGAEGQAQFDLTLTDRANTGVQPFRVDVRASGAEALNFSIYADLTIGDPDLSMEFSTRLNRRGDLEVFQAFINDGEVPRTYRCRLNVEGRVYQSTTIMRQGYGRVESTYTLERANQLLNRGIRTAVVEALPTDGGQPMVYTVQLFED